MALLLLFTLTVHAESDGSDEVANSYESEASDDGIEEIVPEDTDTDIEVPFSEKPINGSKTTLTVMFSALGVIAAGGTASIIYVVRSKNKKIGV